MLKDLKAEGHLERRERRRLDEPGRLPAVTVLEVSGLDPDGELLARPASWAGDVPPPVIYLAPERRSRATYAPGDRVLARLTRIDEQHYEAQPIRRVGRLPSRILGVYEIGERGGRLRPTDRRAKDDLVVRREDAGDAQPGELVAAEVTERRPRAGLRAVRIVQRLGEASDVRNLSLIAISEHELPTEFPPEALAEAERATAPTLGTRTDLREVPLVTIDGADARDFDDAVWAEPDDDPANPGGWHILVAIADVAGYVRPGSALDRAAFDRGNSAYFPDRVVPMLPEVLSNGWCSLRPNEERACLCAELWIDAEGRARRHRFLRGLMRSAARLTYEQVQAAHDGRPDDTTGPLAEPVLRPLYGAFKALLVERERRGTLDIELRERQIVLDERGEVARIVPRLRLDSHRLIEEFMIAANVAAAQQLETLRQPCMYRVHDRPDPTKIEALREVLDSLDLRLARGQVIRPRALTRVLEQVRGRPEATMVNQLVLRSQSQAVYSPENIGHFGLALTRYAHFTSPIRRYADLLVHRALIAGLDFGEGGLSPDAAPRFPEIGEHISVTERRAATAERDALDRFTAFFLKDRVGAIVPGVVNGVTRFGLFVTLDDSGADGLVPIRTLPDDYYDHVEAEHSLVGRRWGRVYRLGEHVRVRLREVSPVTGGILLDLVESDDEAPSPAKGKARDARPRGQGRRTKGGRAATKPARRGGPRRRKR